MDCNTAWADALRELTALPGEAAQAEHGDQNFLRAARFGRRGRRLFEEFIRPAMPPGRSYAVALGFVDREVARAAGIEDAWGHHDFGAASLVDRETGEVLRLYLPEEE